MSDAESTRGSRVSKISEMTGDEAVLAATGRESDAWFALLDAAGATSWTHGAIAGWLSTEHALPGWWTQNLSVRYEQARGMRQPGQQGDGSFSASKSATIAGTLDEVYAAMVAAFGSQLGSPASARAEGKRPFARWKTDTGQGILATAEVVRERRIRVGVVFEKLADTDATGPAKAEIARLLALLG